MTPAQNSLRVLCINPWIFDFAAHDFFCKPLGLLSIAAYLRQRGATVELIDCLDKNHSALLRKQGRTTPRLKRFGTGPFHREIVPTPDVLNYMPRRFARYGYPEDIFRQELQNRARPDAILITSVMTYWYLGPKRVVEICREVYPDVPLVLGGIYASLMPAHAREVVQPDVVLTGPGEVLVAHWLAERFNRPELLENPPNGIDDLPRPAFDLYNKLDYYILVTTRGCPFHCTFCAAYKIDDVFQMRSPEQVVAEIVDANRQFEVRDIAFFDDALLVRPEQHIKPILRGIIQSRKPLRFHTPNGVHARYIDDELAHLMARAQFKTIRMGLESVRQERLGDIHKKITPDGMENAVTHLTRAGFAAHDLEVYIIAGLPGQALDEVIETMLYAHSLGVQIRITSFSPIPGTVDFERGVEQGLFPADMDPLLTNNTAVPAERTRAAYERMHRIRQFSNMLNEGARRGVNLFKPPDFRQAFFKALERFRD